MNIREVDLKGLMERIKSDKPVSSEDINLVDRIIFNFGNVENPVGDIVFVAGSATCLEARIVKGVELMKKGAGKFILLSGGVNMPGDDKTEAEAMGMYCLRNGIEPSRIILEKMSSYTSENILFSARYVNELAANNGIENPRIIAVSSATHLRRVLLCFQKYKDLYCAGTTVIPCQSIHPRCNPADWFEHEKARRVIVSELDSTYNYIYKYGYQDFEI